MLEKPSDFKFVDAESVSDCITDESGNLKPTLPQRADCVSDIPYEDDPPECSVAPMHGVDSAYLTEAILERTAMLALRGSTSTSVDEKIDVCRRIHKPVRTTMNEVAFALYKLAKRWRDDDGNMRATGGFVDFRKDGDLPIEWFPFAPKVTMTGIRKNSFHYPTLLPRNMPASVPYASSVLFPDGNYPHSTSELYQKAMEHIGALEDFKTVRTVFGMHFDVSEKKWVTDDGFIGEDSMSRMKSSHVLDMYSDIEKCDTFVVDPSDVSCTVNYVTRLPAERTYTYDSTGVSIGVWPYPTYEIDIHTADMSGEKDYETSGTGTWNMQFDSKRWCARHTMGFPTVENYLSGVFPHYKNTTEETFSESQITNRWSGLNDQYELSSQTEIRTFTSRTDTAEVTGDLVFPFSAIGQSIWKRDASEVGTILEDAWLGITVAVTTLDLEYTMESIEQSQRGDDASESKVTVGLSMKFLRGTVDPGKSEVRFTLPSVDELPSEPQSSESDVSESFSDRAYGEVFWSDKIANGDTFSRYAKLKRRTSGIRSVGPLIVRVKPYSRLNQ